MSFLEKRPRKWGDRRDGHWVKDAPGINVVMSCLYPKRTDSEVYLHLEVDITDLLRYIEEKNGPGAEYKTTLFHCIVAIVARAVNERPKLNRFVQGARTYERDEITISFVAKRRFTDHSEEALMVYKAKGSDTLADISRRIVGEVHEMREQKQAEGLDDILNKFGRLPRPLLMLIVRTVRWLDFWGKVPKVFTEGDPQLYHCADLQSGQHQVPRRVSPSEQLRHQLRAAHHRRHAQDPHRDARRLCPGAGLCGHRRHAGRAHRRWILFCPLPETHPIYLCPSGTAGSAP